MIGLKREVFGFWVFIVSVVSPIVESGSSDIGSFNYAVDCSACYSLPVQNLDSYSCKVRCEVNDDSKVNLTGIYDVLNQVLVELNRNKERLENTTRELEELRAFKENTTEDLKELRESQENTTKELEELRESKEIMQRRINLLEQKVAFTARLTTDLHTNVGDVIKFDNVQLNIGGGYDDVTGRFTAPSNGTYEFTLITSNEFDNDVARTDLMLGDRFLFRFFSAPDHNSFAVGSILVDLTEGDQVYAKAIEDTTYNNWFNMLSGHKI